MGREGWFSKLKKRWGNREEGEKRVGIYQKLIILAGVGVAVMLFSSFTSVQRQGSTEIRGPNETEQAVLAGKAKQEEQSMADYEDMYEAELKDILEKIVGVGEVSVMVTIESSEEVIVERDVNSRNQTTKEVDREKATREIQEVSKDERVVLVQGQQGEHPIVVKKIAPRVRGVLVVAKGAESMRVKSWIADAVHKALHVEPHKISILPKRG